MENKKVRALALFSGGLDSSLAMKIIKDQGIDVIALNFVSHFFGGKNERAEKMAEQIGVRLEYIDFSEEHMKIVKNPKYGRGKNMNPCIDCHSLMFKVAGNLLEKYDADFLISGEVLGQRPMSQNSRSLEKVKELSERGDIIIRPLCAKNLPLSKPEIEGLVDREKLMDFSGRSRKRQMALAKELGLVGYPTPGGGCLLTDPAYSKRLKIIERDGLLDNDHYEIFHLLKRGRFYRFEEGKYLFVGRSKEDNEKMFKFKDVGTLFIRGSEVGGPYIVGYGELSQEEIEFAKNLFSKYSKFKGDREVEILFNQELVKVPSIDQEKIEKQIKEYQIVMK